MATLASLLADPKPLEEYLRVRFGPDARLLSLRPLGQPEGGDGKAYGYGHPLRIDFTLDGAPRQAVLETVRPGPFGHEHRADRAQNLIWAHSAFNELERHVGSLDVGAFRKSGGLLSVGDADEFFVLMDFAKGSEYALDLERMKSTGGSRPLDLERADALCDYLVSIHAIHGPGGSWYERRIREVIGHGECILGIVDSYTAADPFLEEVREVERRCVDWRWRLKSRAHRLRVVHGDFHPWNILFREGTDFTVLDRSRGEWGEPADDVACLTMNYLFFSLRRNGRFDGPFDALFRRFWDRYLERTGDREILEVAAPFLAFRGLVMASPVWYPGLAPDVRRTLFRFMRNVLAADAFDPGRVRNFLEG